VLLRCPLGAFGRPEKYARLFLYTLLFFLDDADDGIQANDGSALNVLCIHASEPIVEWAVEAQKSDGCFDDHLSALHHAVLQDLVRLWCTLLLPRASIWTRRPSSQFHGA